MSEVLKKLVKATEASPKSRYQLSKECGISQAQLSRLVNGLQGLSMDNAERLAKVLGLELKLTKPTKRGRRR